MCVCVYVYVYGVCACVFTSFANANNTWQILKDHAFDYDPAQLPERLTVFSRRGGTTPATDVRVNGDNKALTHALFFFFSFSLFSYLSSSPPLSHLPHVQATDVDWAALGKKAFEFSFLAPSPIFLCAIPF